MGTLAANLISFWELEDSANGTRLDSVVASAHDLTDVGSSVGRTTGIVGFGSEHVRFNGELLSVASAANLQIGDGSTVSYNFSVSGWVNLASKPAGSMDPFGKDGSTDGEYQMWWDTSDRFGFDIYDAGGTTCYTKTADTLGAPSLSTWYLLTATYSTGSDILTLYVNATSQGTAGRAGGTGYPGDASNFGIGSRPENRVSNSWDGAIDQVGFWRRALSADEVSYLYNAGAGRTYAEIAAADVGGASAPMFRGS